MAKFNNQAEWDAAVDILLITGKNIAPVDAAKVSNTEDAAVRKRMGETVFAAGGGTFSQATAPTNGDPAGIYKVGAAAPYTYYFSDGTTVEQIEIGGQASYNAPQVIQANRATTPVPGDVSLAAWKVDELIERETDAGFEQIFKADSTITSLLIFERQNPKVFLTPPTADGWNENEFFEQLDTSVTPAVVRRWQWQDIDANPITPLVPVDVTPAASGATVPVDKDGSTVVLAQSFDFVGPNVSVISRDGAAVVRHQRRAKDFRNWEVFDTVPMGTLTQMNLSLSADRSVCHVAARSTTPDEGAYTTYDFATKTLNPQVTVRAGQSVDPLLIQWTDTEFWFVVSDNSTRIQAYESTDSGATWALVTGDVMTTATAAHWEDLNFSWLSNGNLLITAELEVADKGDSSTWQVIYDATTRTKVAPESVMTPIVAGQDIESPPTFMLPGDTRNTYMLLAYNEIGDVTYNTNYLHLFRRNGNNWDHIRRMDELGTSHVEYSVLPTDVDGEIWLATNRNLSHNNAAEFPMMAGVMRVPSVLSGQSNWVGIGDTGRRLQQQIIDTGISRYAQISTDTDIGGSNVEDRGFFTRATSGVGQQVDMEFDVELRGDAGNANTPSLRIVFGYIDANNHYLVLAQNAVDARVYHRVGGTYTQIGATAALPAAFVTGSRNTWRVEWNRTTGNIKTFIDGAAMHDVTDAGPTYTDAGRIGFGVGDNDDQSPNRAHRITVIADSGLVWDEQWQDEPAFYPIEQGGSIKFSGNFLERDDGLYMTVENRDASQLTIYKNG